MTFSINVETIFEYASTIVNMLMPIIALTAGLSFGFYLARKIASLFSGGFN